MDFLIKSLDNFKISNDLNKFDKDLDDVIHLFNKQVIIDADFRWEELTSNYSKLIYLNDIIKNYYVPESEKFLLTLEKCIEQIEKTNVNYLDEINWEVSQDEFSSSTYIREELLTSIKSKDPITKMKHILNAYAKLIHIVEEIRKEKFKFDENEVVKQFPYKRRKL